MMAWGIVINLLLAMFNLFPFPPLDGSHVMKYLLPPAWAMSYQRIGFLGFFILLFLIRTPIFTWWMTPAYVGASTLIQGAASVTTIFPHHLAPWGLFR
jgi:Zn-dependent protease